MSDNTRPQGRLQLGKQMVRPLRGSVRFHLVFQGGQVGGKGLNSLGVGLTGLFVRHDGAQRAVRRVFDCVEHRVRNIFPRVIVDIRKGIGKVPVLPRFACEEHDAIQRLLAVIMHLLTWRRSIPRSG